jgi:hypothetical protein
MSRDTCLTLHTVPPAKQPSLCSIPTVHGRSSIKIEGKVGFVTVSCLSCVEVDDVADLGTASSDNPVVPVKGRLVAVTVSDSLKRRMTNPSMTLTHAFSVRSFGLPTKFKS